MLRTLLVILSIATFKTNSNSNGFPNFVIIGTKMNSIKINVGVSVLLLFSLTAMNILVTPVVS
jgi:hypothetical protein